MKPYVVYLHGFASGPNSSKGQALARNLASDVGRFVMPDLEGGDFGNLTMHKIVERTLAAIASLPNDGAPVLLVGSSLGGYIASLIASRKQAPRVRALLLVAPAFTFVDHWAKELGEAGIAAWKKAGSRPFQHHGLGRQVPLTYAFHESCLGLPPMPGKTGLPITIVHGRQDEVVDWRASLAYLQNEADVELHVITGDHRLGEERHNQFIAFCARDLIGPMKRACAA